MPSTNAMFTAMSGLNANARTIDVVGNNISNVNTVAFKGSRVNFQTAFNRTLSIGTAPAETTGGANPFQIGLGVVVSGTQRNFSSGTLSSTGDGRDLAIEGDGFFVVRRGTDQFFTRSGGFRPDAQQRLTTSGGELLQGYGVDSSFNISRGTLRDIRLPVGSLTIADATSNVGFKGNLNASGDLPSRGSSISLLGTATDGLRAVSGAVPAPSAGNVLELATRMVDVADPAVSGGSTPLFSNGQSLEIRNAQKGSKLIPPASLAISSTTTINDFNNWLTAALGIDTSHGTNPDGATPGVSLDPTTGVLSIVGNTGTANDLMIDTSDFRLLSSTGALVRQPLVASKSAGADGESVRTTFVVFDSLGTPLEVDLTLSLESRGNSGTRWRYRLESSDDTNPATSIGSGTLDFDTDGVLATNTPITASIDRTGTGAATPLTISLAFSRGDDSVTALTDDRSAIAATFRDGAPIGTLAGFGVGVDGTITGSFTNGLTRTLGQIALATFTNNEGLLDAGGNLFLPGANSGTPVISSPGELGAGLIVGGALELSNVDISEEFVKMILASTGFSASSRVIRTTDELMQQLLVLGR